MTLDSARARWLECRALAPSIVRLASQVPVPVLASAESSAALGDYLHLWLMNPDPAGQFADKTGWIRCLPKAVRATTLFALGYDGLLYFKDDTIMGHVFYQRHGASIHGFSTAVNGSFDDNGYSVIMILDLVAHAHNTAGINSVRVGTGQNNMTRRFLERIRKHESDFAWHVRLDGWITFDRPASDS